MRTNRAGANEWHPPFSFLPMKNYCRCLLLSRAQGSPTGTFVSRCRPTTALRARRGAAPTMAAILSTAMSVTVAPDGAPRRNQLAPGHGPGSVSRCTHREHCRCTRGGCMCIASCARAPDLSDLALGTYMCVPRNMWRRARRTFVYVDRRARRAHLS